MLVSGFGGSHFSSGWAHNNDLRPGLRWGHQMEWMVVNWILSRLGGGGNPAAPGHDRLVISDLQVSGLQPSVAHEQLACRISNAP